MTSKPEDDKISGRLLCTFAALAFAIGGGNWWFVWPGVVLATHNYEACAPEVRSDLLNCGSVGTDLWINFGFFGFFAALSIFSVISILIGLIGLYRECKAAPTVQPATEATPAGDN